MRGMRANFVNCFRFKDDEVETLSRYVVAVVKSNAEKRSSLDELEGALVACLDDFLEKGLYFLL
jgi:hypothetical protein